MEHPNHQLIRDFFAAIVRGDVPDEMLTSDMTAWMTTGGTRDKVTFQQGIRLLRRMCTQLDFTVTSLTAEDDLVAAEVEGNSTLINGEPYNMAYVFVFRIRDGRIASMAEHYNALIVQEKLIPLMQSMNDKIS